MKIICKSILLPPEPTFVGTRFTIEVPADNTVWGFRNLFLADGHERVTIDWGDGQVTTVGREAEEYYTEHDYGQAGKYEVMVSDDIANYKIYQSIATDRRYNELLTCFECHAVNLTTLNADQFYGAIRLKVFDIAGSGIVNVVQRAFWNCTSLSGRIDFPGVREFKITPGWQPFKGCTGGITEIHFDTAMEPVITTNAGYLADKTLGTGTAVCKFDL